MRAEVRLVRRQWSRQRIRTGGYDVRPGGRPKWRGQIGRFGQDPGKGNRRRRAGFRDVDRWRILIQIQHRAIHQNQGAVSAGYETGSRIVVGLNLCRAQRRAVAV
jgi:hypothetical protein